jgi:hypothetical protein
VACTCDSFFTCKVVRLPVLLQVVSAPFLGNFCSSFVSFFLEIRGDTSSYLTRFSEKEKIFYSTNVVQYIIIFIISRKINLCYIIFFSKKFAFSIPHVVGNCKLTCKWQKKSQLQPYLQTGKKIFHLQPHLQLR